MKAKLVKSVESEPSPPAQDPDVALGAAIRKARLGKGMTLKQLSEKIDVSIGLLSQIERGRNSLSVRVLRSICGALNIDGAKLFHSDETIASKDGDVVVRRDARRHLQFTDQNIVKYKLTPAEPGPLEAYLMELRPGGKSGDELYSHPGFEFGYVLEGRMEVFIDDTSHLIDAGDTIRFASTRMHKWRNGWNGRTVVIWVLSAPIYI